MVAALLVLLVVMAVTIFQDQVVVYFLVVLDQTEAEVLAVTQLH
jgi:hypothetical protein